MFGVVCIKTASFLETQAEIAEQKVNECPILNLLGRKESATNMSWLKLGQMIHSVKSLTLNIYLMVNTLEWLFSWLKMFWSLNNQDLKETPLLINQLWNLCYHKLSWSLLQQYQENQRKFWGKKETCFWCQFYFSHVVVILIDDSFS